MPKELVVIVFKILGDNSLYFFETKILAIKVYLDLNSL